MAQRVIRRAEGTSVMGEEDLCLSVLRCGVKMVKFVEGMGLIVDRVLLNAGDDLFEGGGPCEEDNLDLT